MNDKLKVGIAAILLVAAAILILFTVKVGPVEAQQPTATLVWTAPGDDGDVGRATSYQARYSRTAVGQDTLAWWNSANVVPNLPAPSVSGTQDSVVVPLGSWSMQYYFVVRACDEASNCGSWSNVAVKAVGAAPDATPPRRIIDLITRP